MAFPRQFLDELKLRSSLSDVIGKRVQLRKKGREWEGLCPFHKEKTPSFTVNEEKGFYHCFGCGEHGSIFDFVMKTVGLTFPEVVEQLAQNLGMQVPQATPEGDRHAEHQKKIETITEAACGLFEHYLQMPEGKVALNYLKDRGVDNETIKVFRLGFAPKRHNFLKDNLSRDGISEEMLLDAGLLIQTPSENDSGRLSGSPYNRFRERVIFPIMNRQNRVIAFGGRAIGNSKPKYLNSPETPIFRKGHVLYGLSQALPAAHKSGRLIVTEGYMDVISLHMAGFKDVVAPLGTALTEDHLRMVWKVAREPILCFDGDNAGRKAAARAAERALPLLKSGYGLRFAELPEGDDPDTLIRKNGSEVMHSILDNSLPLSEVLWRMETGDQTPKTPEKRAAVQVKLGAHTRRIEDPTIRAHFAAAFKDRIWRRGNDRLGRSQSRPRFTQQDAQFALSNAGIQRSKADIARRTLEILLVTLINHPILYDDISEELGALNFTPAGETLDNLRQEVLKTLALETGLDNRGLIDRLNKNGFTSVLDALMRPDVLGDAFFARPEVGRKDALNGWKEVFERMQWKDLEAEIAVAQKQLEADFTEEKWERLQFLRKQINDAADAQLADERSDELKI